jgi:hypothetical protein
MTSMEDFHARTCKKPKALIIIWNRFRDCAAPRAASVFQKLRVISNDKKIRGPLALAARPNKTQSNLELITTQHGTLI